MNWWQPLLDAVPPLANGGIVVLVLGLIARGTLWTRAAVAVLEHERDQAIVDRDFYRKAWMESQATVVTYAESATRVAIPAATAAQRHLQAISDLASGGVDHGPQQS